MSANVSLDPRVTLYYRNNRISITESPAYSNVHGCKVTLVLRFEFPFPRSLFFGQNRGLHIRDIVCLPILVEDRVGAHTVYVMFSSCSDYARACPPPNLMHRHYRSFQGEVLRQNRHDDPRARMVLPSVNDPGVLVLQACLLFLLLSRPHEQHILTTTPIHFLCKHP